jgi:hypothetical protein
LPGICGRFGILAQALPEKPRASALLALAIELLLNKAKSTPAAEAEDPKCPRMCYPSFKGLPVEGGAGSCAVITPENGPPEQLYGFTSEARAREWLRRQMQRKTYGESHVEGYKLLSSRVPHIV